MLRAASSLLRRPTLRRFASTDVVTERAFGSGGGPPITIIGGFLGAGKTTAIQHMLSNRAGLRVGLVVNDVASVNVDGAQLRRDQVGASSALGNVQLIELENGCVCCGPDVENLAPTVRALQNREDAQGRPALDHVVIELSGVADPSSVQGRLAAEGLQVERTVSLLDANAFPAMYMSRAALHDRPELIDRSVAESLAGGAVVCEVEEQVVELAPRLLQGHGPDFRGRRHDALLDDLFFE